MENSKVKVSFIDPDTNLNYNVDFSFNDGTLSYDVTSDVGSADPDKAYITNILFGIFMDAVQASGDQNPPAADTGTPLTN